MTAQDIISTIREETADLASILFALEDGAYLASIGLTDDDQEAVEEAHAIISESIRSQE